MGFPTPAGQIWQLRINYLCRGQRLLNVLHYRQTISRENSDVVAGDVFDSFQGPGNTLSQLLEVVAGSVEVTHLDVQPIRPTRFRSYRFPIGEVGSRPGTSAPPNVATVITRAGDLAGRRNVGAIHLPPPAAADVQFGTVSPELNGELVGLAEALQEDILDAATNVLMTPVLIGRAPSTATVPVTRFIVQNTTRVMRRRTVGLGE